MYICMSLYVCVCERETCPYERLTRKNEWKEGRKKGKNKDNCDKFNIWYVHAKVLGELLAVYRRADGGVKFLVFKIKMSHQH